MLQLAQIMLGFAAVAFRELRRQRNILRRRRHAARHLRLGHDVREDQLALVGARQRGGERQNGFGPWRAVQRDQDLVEAQLADALSLVRVRRDDQDGGMRPRDDLLRRAAQDPTAQPAFSMAGQDDQVDLMLLGELNDLFGRAALNQLQCRRHPTRFELTLELGEMAVGFGTDDFPLHGVHLPARTRSSMQLEHAQQRDPPGEGSRDCRRKRQRALRQRRAVQRDQDMAKRGTFATIR